ncbi:hypothetical protein KY289_016430 [Solanum tuberosum]|nr:hypothetical protein KY289_016430 [Solanum tuberosum]
MNPSMEVQVECLHSEPGCAESKANSHASTEVTDSTIDESEVQSPVSRTRGEDDSANAPSRPRTQMNLILDSPRTRPIVRKPVDFSESEEFVAGDVIFSGSDRLLSQVVPKAGIGLSEWIANTV